jgi:hypothetical protein
MNRTPTIHSLPILCAALAIALAAAAPARAQQPASTPEERSAPVAAPPVVPATAAAPAGPSAPVEDPLAEQRAAIARLAGWAGEWEGTGWAFTRAGRGEFTIRESVQLKLGGVALLVQGLGKSKPADGGEEVVTHDALAVLTWDPEGDRYLFRHYTADGHEGESVLEPFEDGWRWGFRDPRHGVDVRFTIRLGADAWHETGEVSRDGGATWQQMLAMELRRVGG